MTTFDDRWEATARDVRAALAACIVEIVDTRTDHLTSPDTAQVCTQVWGEFTDLLYPTTQRSQP